MDLKPKVDPRSALQALIVDVTTAGHLLGVSRNSAYAAVKAGTIPSLKIGRRIAVPTAPLRRMLGVDDDRPDAA